MNGIKVNLDSAMVSLVKEQFNALITELESKAQVKLNINFGDSINNAGSQMNTLKEQVNNIMSSGNLSSGFKAQMDSNVITAKEDIVKIKGSLSEIEAEYKKLGNYKIMPEKFDANGNLKSFTVELEQVEGLIDKISYKANTFEGLKNGQLKATGWTSTGITETDKTAEVAKRNLKEQEALINDMANAREKSNINAIADETKLGETQAKYANQAIEANAKEEQSNITLNAQEESKLKLIQMQYAEKINLLRANNSASSTTGQINSLQDNVSGLASTGSIGLEQLKQQYNEIVRLQSQLNADKLTDQRLTSESVNAQLKENEALQKAVALEEQRIAKMGTSQGTLSTGFFDQSNKQIMRYGQSLLDTGEKMKSFQRTTDEAGNSIIKMTSTTTKSNGQTQINTRTFDENTNAVYKNEGAIKMGNTGLDNMVTKMKSAIGSVISFTLVTGSLYVALSKLKEGFTFINELNKTQTNIKMITGMDDNSVQQLTKDYSNLGTTLHETTSQIMTASEEFLRAGNNQKDTAALLQSSTVMSKIAGQSQKDSADSLISIMNAYKLSANDMIGVVDKMVAVD